jgi:hypothetical protein
LIDFKVKTIVAASVAGSAGLLNKTQNSITVTIQPHRLQCLEMPASFTFYPFFLSASGPVGHAPSQ